MNKQSKTAEAKTAYGKTLETPIVYNYDWETYDTFEELAAAKDELTNDEQVKVRNTERQSNARQKALTAALDLAGIVKPTAENDPQIALRDMFKTLQTAKLADGSRKHSDEQARQIAATLIGVDWAE